MKTKKLLYIDFLTSFGHILYNQIQIEAFKKLGYDVWVICRESQYSHYERFGVHKGFVLKDKYYRNNIVNRLYIVYAQFKAYLFARKTMFDHVIIGCYDTITLFLMPQVKNTYIVNHVNPQLLANPIKLFLTKLISKTVIHVALNKDIENFLKGVLKTDRVVLVPHGFRAKEEIPFTAYWKEFDTYKKIIFSPSSESTDINLIKNLISQKGFVSYLERNNYLLVLKGHYEQPQSRNIICLKRYLVEQEYNELFLKSDVIMVWYNQSFKNRVSGVLFECIGNDKVVSIADIPSFRSMSEVFNYNPYLISKSCDDIISHFDYLFTIQNKTAYINKNQLLPINYWKGLLC